MTKEIRNPNTKIRNWNRLAGAASSFGLGASFVIRASCFVIRQGGSKRADKGHRARVVAVDAEGLYAAGADQPLHLSDRLGRVLNEGAGLRARDQRTIGTIPAVGKALGDEGAA